MLKYFLLIIVIMHNNYYYCFKKNICFIYSNPNIYNNKYNNYYIINII